MNVSQNEPSPTWSGEHLARWCRSLVVTSGADLVLLRKAQACAADIVLYDLEDGVAAAHKEEARKAFRRVRSEELRRPLGLRINPPRSDDGLRDLAMLESAPAQPLVVVLPKVESAGEVRMVDELLARAGSGAWLWAIVETGRGVLNVCEIAQSCRRLTAISFGAADFCGELGMALKWDPLLNARSQVVLAARTAGLGVVDSPTFRLDHPGVLAFESSAASDLGFTGKIAIHTSQIETINRAFTPSREQVDWATSVIRALEGGGSAIATVSGQMVGPPFLRAAKRILARAGQVPI